MALSFAHGAIQWLTSDALNATKVVSGLPFQPKAIRFYWIGYQSATTASSSATPLQERRGVGFAVSTSSRRSVGTFSQAWNGGTPVGTSNCGSAARDDCVVCTTDGAGASDGRLDISAIAADGFTLIVDDVTPANITVFWEAWGGDDITVAAVGDITEPAATGDQDYTVTGFTATGTDQVVMFAGVQDPNALNTDYAEASSLHVGFASSPTDQITVLGSSDDASTSMDTDGHCRTGQCISMIIPAGAATVNAYASLTQWNANGFRLNWAARATTGRRSIFLAIKGGCWKASSYTIDGSSANATATVSGFPMAPRGACFIGRMGATSTATNAQANDRIGFGTATGTSDRRSMGILDEDATASSNVEIDCSIDYEACLCFPSTSGTLQSAYDINAWNSDGFQVIVDTAGGVASEWQGYLLFGDSNNFANRRTNIIAGLTSAQGEAAGWNAKVKPNIPVANVVRTSDTVVTITLQAQADYDITAEETITATVPAVALAGGVEVVATPGITIGTSGPSNQNLAGASPHSTSSIGTGTLGKGPKALVGLAAAASFVVATGTFNVVQALTRVAVPVSQSVVSTGALGKGSAALSRVAVPASQSAVSAGTLGKGSAALTRVAVPSSTSSVSATNLARTIPAGVAASTWVAPPSAPARTLPTAVASSAWGVGAGDFVVTGGAQALSRVSTPSSASSVATGTVGKGSAALAAIAVPAATWAVTPGSISISLARVATPSSALHVAAGNLGATVALSGTIPSSVWAAPAQTLGKGPVALTRVDEPLSSWHTAGALMVQGGPQALVATSVPSVSSVAALGTLGKGSAALTRVAVPSSSWGVGGTLGLALTGAAAKSTLTVPGGTLGKGAAAVTGSTPKSTWGTAGTFIVLGGPQALVATSVPHTTSSVTVGTLAAGPKALARVSVPASVSTVASGAFVSTFPLVGVAPSSAWHVGTGTLKRSLIGSTPVASFRSTPGTVGAGPAALGTQVAISRWYVAAGSMLGGGAPQVLVTVDTPASYFAVTATAFKFGPQTLHVVGGYVASVTVVGRVVPSITTTGVDDDGR